MKLEPPEGSIDPDRVDESTATNLLERSISLILLQSGMSGTL